MGGSELAKALDVARGGQFKGVPKKYPSKAWFTYTDKTCNYKCMGVEYFYWGLTSHLGGQIGRANDQMHEWKLGAKGAMAKDKLLTKIITDPSNKLPTKLPDGKYSAHMQDPCANHK